MSGFRYLSLADLKLGMDDLFIKRLAALRSSSFGKSYEPLFVAKQAAIDALPEALRGGKPLAEALADTDDEHDGFGGAIWHMTEAYLRLPVQDAVMVAAIARVRERLIPQLADLRESYADQAEAAVRRKDQLPQLEADLKLIPVTMGGSSLYDWAVGFLNAGEKLSALISDRADLTGPGRAGAQTLRSATVSLLNRARGAIAEECAASATLPKDLDDQIFGYFVELEAFRKEAVARRRKGKGEG